ncbi:FkbM family methyltransferase [Alphaproteobacteria bacterium]|nr:FkbM family methyltransferase [Alphaproteobacteria bacterium]
MTGVGSNEARSEEYFKNFDRKTVLKNLVNSERPTIFDVGANLGQSLKEFKLWWNKAQVHCFEPLEECWEPLEKIAFSHPADSVLINKFAIGRATEKGKVFYSHEVDNTKGTSGFNKINIKSQDSIDLQKLKVSKNSQSKIDAYKSTINHARKVNVLRMDEYMVASGIDHVDLVKIDTQGHEPEVLQGFGQSLKNIKIIILELMFYDYYERSISFYDLEKLLIPAGFHLYDISHISKNPMNGRTDWVDVIYLNRRFK